MDATDFIVTDVADLAITCDVYEQADSGAYNGGFSKVGEKDVHIFAPSSQQRVTLEGSGQETAFTGLAVVDHDVNGDPVHTVEVNHQLRPQANSAKHYDVRVKDGLPNDVNPVVWRLGLDRANSSE